MNSRMTKAEFFKWLDQQIPDAEETRRENPWITYEDAKGTTKRELCGFPANPDWKLYDYYQPMIVEWSKVFGG